MAIGYDTRMWRPLVHVQPPRHAPARSSSCRQHLRCGKKPELGMPVLEFRAVTPNRGIIRTEAHVLAFRREFNKLLMALNGAGVRVPHILPATPLSASVEIGRMLLTKTFEAVYAWEWQVSNWKQALRLK